MDHIQLQKRLQDLGAAIPESTLRRWASEELIASPTPYYEKREKKVGSPFKNLTSTKETRGRHMNWPEETFEDAAAVWSIRKWKRNVPNSIIKQVKQDANTFNTLLNTDCKKASRVLRTFLCPDGFPSQEDGVIAGLSGHFNANILHPYTVSWIADVERVRHKIPLDNSIHISYIWIIRENGQSEFQAKHVTQTVWPLAGTTGMKLQITHLKPLENGYSEDYGFPKVDVLMEGGFVDIFKLSAFGKIDERFRIYSGGRRYENYKNIDHTDLDPDGYADYLAELEYGDFY